MLDFLIHHTPLLYLTQSLWRDEVFSIFMAAKPISFFVKNLSFEPPFYYLILHYWMKLFGTSEIATRSLSLLAFSLAIIILIYWSEKLFNKHWLSWWLPLFFFLNPMLLYYAMEVRTYGWYTLFVILSLFAYHEKRWAFWVAATVLGFYTHTYFIIVPFAQTIHYLFTHKMIFSRGIRRAFADPMIRAGAVSLLGMLPWFVKIMIEATRLKSSWYFPVDGNLVTSVLGNLFTGYEGTPGGLWTFTKYLSLLFLGVSVLAWRKKGSRRLVGLLLTLIYLPLAAVIGISFIKPLYVNRYMIAVTVAQVILVAQAIRTIKNPWLQKAAGFAAIAFVVGFNVWYPNKHAKMDIRSIMMQINAMQGPNDVVMADNTLILFETMYYSRDRSRVYLYNPDNNPFPWYIGENIVDPSHIVNEYPPYPVRAFMVYTDGSFDIVFRAPLSDGLRPKAL